MDIFVILASVFISFGSGFVTARIMDPILDKRRAKARKAAAAKVRYAAKKNKVDTTTAKVIKTAKQPAIME